MYPCDNLDKFFNRRTNQTRFVGAVLVRENGSLLASDNRIVSWNPLPFHSRKYRYRTQTIHAKESRSSLLTKIHPRNGIYVLSFPTLFNLGPRCGGISSFLPQENLNRRSTNGRISIKSRRRVSAAEQLSRGHISSIVATIIVSPPTFLYTCLIYYRSTDK